MAGITSSCDDAKKSQGAPAEVTQKIGDTLTIPKLSGIKPGLPLTLEASEAVKNWVFYNNLSQAIDSLLGATMSELRPRIDGVAAVFQEKETAEEAEAPTTPETVQTTAIQARILAIQTQLNILRNNSDRNIPDVDKVAVAIVKVKNGLQNLNLQLNERFSMSIKDLLEEIKNEKDDTLKAPQSAQPSRRPRMPVY